MTGPGALTVLTSVGNLLMTKRIRRDAKTGRLIKSPYPNEKFFRVAELDLAGFSDLARALSMLVGASCLCSARRTAARGEPGKNPAAGSRRAQNRRPGEFRRSFAALVRS